MITLPGRSFLRGVDRARISQLMETNHESTHSPRINFGTVAVIASDWLSTRNTKLQNAGIFPPNSSSSGDESSFFNRIQLRHQVFVSFLDLGDFFGQIVTFSPIQHDLTFLDVYVEHPAMIRGILERLCVKLRARVDLSVFCCVLRVWVPISICRHNYRDNDPLASCQLQ